MLLRFCALHQPSQGDTPDTGSAAAGMILNIAYGYTPKDSDDPLVILADECMSATVAAGGPGAVLCDMIPARTFPHVVVGAPL
jgi:hypothetical protein